MLIQSQFSICQSFPSIFTLVTPCQVVLLLFWAVPRLRNILAAKNAPIRLPHPVSRSFPDATITAPKS